MRKKVDKSKIIDDILSDNNELDRGTVEKVVNSFFNHTKKHIINGDEILYWGLFSVSFVEINNKNVSSKPGKTSERKVLNGVLKPHIKLSKSIRNMWKEKNNKPHC